MNRHYPEAVHIPTYTTWRMMLERCRPNASIRKQRFYFNRGITVCQQWHRFRGFLRDMGERPAGKTLDRINTQGNYEPSNCRWATQKEQCNNMRSNRRITAFGETKTLTQWSEEFSIERKTLSDRIDSGWEIEEALTVKPVHGRNQYWHLDGEA